MEQKWWAASVRKNTVMIAFNDFDPEFPGFRTVPSWRGFGSSLPCRRETTAQHQMDHTSGVCLHHHSYFAFFHLERFLSAYISEFWIKVCFMSRSFAKPAFSRTVILPSLVCWLLLTKTPRERSLTVRWTHLIRGVRYLSGFKPTIVIQRRKCKKANKQIKWYHQR